MRGEPSTTTADTTTANSVADERHAIRSSWLSRVATAENLVLLALLILLSLSWYYSWFLDGSKPIGGNGWADQGSYRRAAWRIADWHLPTGNQAHYPAGYALLGSLGARISRGDPYWIVSYSLLMGSAVFLYRGARVLLNSIWLAALFLIILFAWDLQAGTLNSVSEVFAVPWNNQVQFFAMAFFFWLYTARVDKPMDRRILISIGAIAGFTTMTREESVLFTVPLAAFYLWFHRATLRDWTTAGISAIVAGLPGLLIKVLVLGNPFSSGRSGGYGRQTQLYFSPQQFVENLLGTVVHSDFAPRDYGRISLLEAQPWLWLAPLGIAIVFASRRFHTLTKVYTGLTTLMLVFYLSGANVTAAKLRYGSLRYLSPGFIVLALGVVVVIQQIGLAGKSARRTKRKPLDATEYSIDAEIPDVDTPAVNAPA